MICAHNTKSKSLACCYHALCANTPNTYYQQVKQHVKAKTMRKLKPTSWHYLSIIHHQSANRQRKQCNNRDTLPVCSHPKPTHPKPATIDSQSTTHQSYELNPSVVAVNSAVITRRQRQRWLLPAGDGHSSWKESRICFHRSCQSLRERKLLIRLVTVIVNSQLGSDSTAQQYITTCEQ